jgi:chromosome transmission fidelity protein 4
MRRDALPPSVTTSGEIHRQELERDKVLISLIQTACKADKLERALDYTSMLHHLASFDLAQKVADFYHLPGLKEKMAALRDVREDVDGVNGEERDVRRGWGRISEPVPRVGVANLDHSNGINYRNGHDRNKREFEDFRPPPVVPRRSLAAAPPFPPSARSELPMPSSPPGAASSSSVQYVSGLKDDVFSETPDSSNVSGKRKYDEDADTSTSELFNLSPKKKVSPFRQTALPSAPAKSTCLSVTLSSFSVPPFDLVYLRHKSIRPKKN